jgi:hypothetical protein
VFATSEDVVAGLDGAGGEIVVDRDFTLAMIAGLLKAAHLTLFRMLGYSYALSPGGRLIGKDVLGRFIDDFRGKPSRARPELESYFREWRNAVRPIVSIGANNYRGTVDDGSVLEIRSSSGTPFAIGVFIRTNDDFHLVIVPGNDNADSLATYLSFIKSPPNSFAAKHVRYNRDSECWETNRDEPTRFEWPSDE